MAKKAVIIPSVILIAAVLLSFVSVGASVKIDGYTNEKIWDGRDTQILVPCRDTSNSQVSFAVFSFFTEEISNSLYMSFKVCVDGTAVTDETLHGLMMNINNCGFITVSHQGISDYDPFLFAVEAAVSQYNSVDYCVECRLGIKDGLQSLEIIEVRFIDAEGICSNSYYVDLEQVFPPEETTSVFPVTQEESTTPGTTDYTTSITATRTTEPPTTEKTTQERTTASTTVASKTTAETTRKAKKTTAVRKTDVKTTAADTVSVGTTVIQTDIVTIYVTVTQPYITAADSSVVSEAALSTGDERYEEKLSEYKELKYAAIIGLIILAFGVCVMVNSGHNGGKDRTE